MTTREHTGSYYAASVGDHTRYPPLRGEQRADVCVVGAGFTGISTALHLAERGFDVHVVEANRVGWGASPAKKPWPNIMGSTSRSCLPNSAGPDTR